LFSLLSNHFPWNLVPGEQNLPTIDTLTDRSTTFIDSLALESVRKLLQAQYEKWKWAPQTSGQNAPGVEAIFDMAKICVLLNITNLQHRLTTFIRVGLTDKSPPLELGVLMGLLDDREAKLFYRAQPRAQVRDFSIHGSNYFSPNQLVPIRTLRNLGHGGWSKVDEVVNVFSGTRFARKLFSLDQARRVKLKRSFEGEILSLQKLNKHRHIIQYLFSYETERNLALILSPVADCNLKQYLTIANPDEYNLGDRTEILRQCLGCLASALAFMHSHKSKFQQRAALAHETRV
jgi:hypothetical protein